MLLDGIPAVLVPAFFGLLVCSGAWLGDVDSGAVMGAMFAGALMLNAVLMFLPAYLVHRRAPNAAPFYRELPRRLLDRADPFRGRSVIAVWLGLMLCAAGVAVRRGLGADARETALCIAAGESALFLLMLPLARLLERSPE